MGVLTVAVAVLSLAAAATAAERENCSIGFQKIDGHCFAFRSGLTVSWEEAKVLCSEMGSNIVLASIKSPETLRGIYTYLMTYGLTGSFWLGGSDLPVEDDWHWVDGSRVARGTPYWAIHNSILGWVQEPDGSAEENCLALDADRKYYFNDLPCSLQNHAVCQEVVHQRRPLAHRETDALW